MRVTEMINKSSGKSYYLLKAFYGFEKIQQKFPRLLYQPRLVIKIRLVLDWQTALKCNPGRQ
jgi:hypothetical protein